MQELMLISCVYETKIRRFILSGRLLVKEPWKAERQARLPVSRNPK